MYSWTYERPESESPAFHFMMPEASEVLGDGRTFQLIHHRTGLCSLLDRELGVLQRFDGSLLSGVEDVGDLGVTSGGLGSSLVHR